VIVPQALPRTSLVRGERRIYDESILKSENNPNFDTANHLHSMGEGKVNSENVNTSSCLQIDIDDEETIRSFPY